MAQMERGNNTPIASPSSQLSQTTRATTTINQMTTALTMTALAPNAGDSFPTGAQHKSSATFSATVARAPGAPTGNDKTEETRNATTGWAMSWGQLLWEKWRWGAVIALAVLVSRFSSSTWPRGCLFMLSCETPMCQFRSPISCIWSLWFIWSFVSSDQLAHDQACCTIMNLPHISPEHVPFVFFFSSTYYPFIPAIYLVLGSRLFVSFVGKVWTLIQLSIFSSFAWVLVNASVFRVVPGVGITYDSPTCFPRGYNTENSSDYQKTWRSDIKKMGIECCVTHTTAARWPTSWLSSEKIWPYETIVPGVLTTGLGSIPDISKPTDLILRNLFYTGTRSRV